MHRGRADGLDRLPPVLPAVRALAGRVPDSAAPYVVLLLGGIDLAWGAWLDVSFLGWQAPFVAVLGLLALSVFYRVARPMPALAELPAYGALWIAFSIAGAVATYYAAATARPLQDAAFAAFDAGIGFDWVAWTGAMRAHPVLNGVLRLAYASLIPQVVLSLVLFALARVRGRNDELLLAAGTGLLLTTAIAALLPAAGPWVHHGVGALTASDTAYAAHVAVLRDGGPCAFPLGELQGIVCFPSYHTTLAVLLAHAHRGLRSFLPAAVLNGLMLLSVPSEGGHYLADMAGGAAVALLALGAVHVVRARNALTAKRPPPPNGTSSGTFT